MWDILDGYKYRHLAVAGVFKPSSEYSTVNKSVALYKRISGTVDHVEQSRLDPDYYKLVTPVANTFNVNNERVGTLINTFI